MNNYLFTTFDKSSKEMRAIVIRAYDANSAWAQVIEKSDPDFDPSKWSMSLISVPEINYCMDDILAKINNAFVE